MCTIDKEMPSNTVNKHRPLPKYTYSPSIPASKEESMAVKKDQLIYIQPQRKSDTNYPILQQHAQVSKLVYAAIMVLVLSRTLSPSIRGVGRIFQRGDQFAEILLTTPTCKIAPDFHSFHIHHHRYV